MDQDRRREASGRMQSSSRCKCRLSIDSIPNEIFASILALLSSDELLCVVSSSRRFYSVGTHVLYRRLMDAAGLPDNELMLECYHPSAKISTPYLACRFRGTKVADGGRFNDQAPRLGDLGRLYSSFRPVVADSLWQSSEETQQRRRQRQLRRMRLQSRITEWAESQSLPQSNVSSNEQHKSVLSDENSEEDEAATQDISLDEGELFSQLCTAANVVKQSSRPGLFVSHVNTCDGVVRVWRDWLADMSSRGSLSPSSSSSSLQSSSSSLASSISSRSDSGFAIDDVRYQSKLDGELDDASSIEMNRDDFLWVDTEKSLGLRFRVEPLGEITPEPSIIGRSCAEAREEPPVSYTLVYEELLVRTSKLLWAVETAASQVVPPSSKAVVIALFQDLVV